MKFDEGTSRRINPRTRNASVPVSKRLSRRRYTNKRKEKERHSEILFGDLANRTYRNPSRPPSSFLHLLWRNGFEREKEGRKEGSGSRLQNLRPLFVASFEWVGVGSLVSRLVSSSLFSSHPCFEQSRRWRRHPTGLGTKDSG